MLHVHIDAETLRAGDGVVRVEGVGPMLASQLGELFGHERFVVRPVIDLAERVSVDAYEIPDRIRERVRLTHVTCRFPWCNAPATVSMDLDHVVPFDDTGPPGQTSTDNLVPLCRWHHRGKTHGRWRYRRLDDGGLEWTAPSGAMFRVDHTGTVHIDRQATQELGRSAS
ncbi:MAG: HNH endonuclease signature motif containing protein, partial [Nocardioidaceae bacterium]